MLKLLLNAEIYAPEALGIQNLLVAGGQVVWIGTDRPRLPNMSTFDLEGRRVIPGLIDGHAHLTGGGGEAGFSSRVPPVPLSAFTRAGITTVVGVLGTDDTTRNTQGLLAQARGLREEGLNAFCHCGGYHLPPVTLTGSVRSDIVNLDPIIGVGEIALSDHRSSQPTLQELLRIASEAHVAGLISGKAGILHLHLGDGERGLDLVRQALACSEIPARVFNPTHVNRKKSLFAEALELAAQGVTIDVTAFPICEEADELSAEDAVIQYLQSGLDSSRITVSSDGGGCLPRFDSEGRVSSMDIGNPSSLFDALAGLLRHGLDLAQALPAFTCNVADLLRLSQKGRIALGLDADLVVLDKSNAVHDVMIGGQWHVQYARPVVRGRFETE